MKIVGNGVVEHHFAWNVLVETGQVVDLFARPDTIHPVRSIDMDRVDGRATVGFDIGCVITQILVDYDKAVVEVDIGTAVWSYVGSLLRYSHPASGVLAKPLIVPVRQSLALRLRTLPVAPTLGYYPPQLIAVAVRVLFARGAE